MTDKWGHVPTFSHFQSAGSNHFRFPLSRYKYTCVSAPQSSKPHGEPTELKRSRAHTAIQEKKTWPLELQLCFCWASSALSWRQVGTRNRSLWPLLLLSHLLPPQTRLAPVSHLFLCLPAAQRLLDCCKTASTKKLPVQVIRSYSIQEEGRGCDIKATV